MARVLVAEDEDGVRLLYARWLGDDGHAVTEARDGAEAQAILAGQDFDVVVIDLLMPRVDGISIIKDLSAKRTRSRRPGTRNCDTRIVAISAGQPTLPASVGLPLSAMFGADDVLYKPFGRSELLAVVARLLG